MRNTPREVLEAMADALGRDLYRAPVNPAVDIEPVGPVSHDRAARIAKLARRLGVLEAHGYVSAQVDRQGKVVGWKLTDKGREAG